MGETLDMDERVHVTWLYYMEGLSQTKIAELMGVSRLTVHRVLQKCQEEGIVHVTIEHPGARCASLAARIQQTFDLKHAMVIPTASSETILKETLGKTVARLVSRHLREGAILGVGWGSTLAQAARFFSGKFAGDLTVVSLLGGATRGNAVNPYEVALRIATTLDAACYYCAAPAIVDSKESRDVILGLENIKATLSLGRQAQLALIGIGEVSSRCTLAQIGMLNPEEIQRLQEAGAVADLLGTFIDINGNPVEIDINERTVSVGFDSLGRIEEVFAVAGGLAKVQAILAALRSRKITHLVTDETTAEHLLQLHEALNAPAAAKR